MKQSMKEHIETVLSAAEVQAAAKSLGFSDMPDDVSAAIKLAKASVISGQETALLTQLSALHPLLDEWLSGNVNKGIPSELEVSKETMFKLYELVGTSQGETLKPAILEQEYKVDADGQGNSTLADGYDMDDFPEIWPKTAGASGIQLRQE